jgi:integrase
MASITRDPNGHRTIQFVAKDGKRRSIRLGKVSQRVAGEIKVKVEQLNAAAVAGGSLDNETAAWVAKLGDDLANKLAAVGLIASRTSASARIGDFVAAYIAKRTDAKPRTVINLKQFGDRLTDYFGHTKSLAEIKRSDADEWVSHLKAKGYAPSTVGRTIKGARQLFNAAVRAEVIRSNPFDGIKASSHQDKDRQHFIPQPDTRLVLDACPDAEWRLLVALSRYGGLRCPSEHLALLWADVDWGRQRFLVRSPKTGERWIPLFPELLPHLEAAFEQAEPGAVYVIAKHRDTNTNLRTRFTQIIRRAGLTPWPKVFHNLRASRQTELAATYPLHVVCAWIGNSTLIAHKHYLQTTEDDFAKAAKPVQQAVQYPVQNPVQQAPATGSTGLQGEREGNLERELVQSLATGCDTTQNYLLLPAGLEPANLWV